ncbi:hypothetical protein WA026_009969 [Henosepilachna vigintioctopunctata]|uniref:Sushi, von Willebrand factor type A, EGF and pentraxin domain-containing protein 1 n=1 Tax=Henosepilachna vigintioctopunctata TaxID=420089 RepID=A0AAW1TKK0_9CUCU
MPECSANKYPKEVIQNATIDIEPDFECSEADKMNEIENDLQSFLTNEICVDNCTISTNSKCLDEVSNEKEEEISNIIKRHAPRPKSTQNKNKRRRKKFRINIQVREKYSKDSRILTKLDHKSGSIVFDQPQFICPAGYISKRDFCVQCPRGTYQVKNKCLSCEFGFYSSEHGVTSCTPCPQHFSTRKLRSKSITECKKQCPPGTHARKKAVKNPRRHHKKIIERPTLEPFCKSCPVGYYQDEYGQLECSPCPKGYTTYGYGSTNVGECIESAEEICLKSKNICNNGKCSVRDRIHYQCDCFEGYVGSHCEKRKEICRNNPCQNGGSCVVGYDNTNQPEYKCMCFENYFGSFCEKVVNKCKLKCMNGGSCFEYDDNQFMCLCTEGYTGELCEPETPYCVNDICENNGTCLEKSTTYECECPNGFIGKRCHLLPCDFKPCPQNAICINTNEDKTSRNSYRCVCTEGWSGESCNTKLNFCSPNSCKNNGTCTNLPTNFECNCPKPFHGANCENEYNANYSIVFERFKTSDYVRLPVLEIDLQEISVCLWLKVTDNFNYGTLVSYATRENDNAFTLTDYTGLIMYVNGQYIATNVFLNDGIWHHVCATWRSNEGIYQVYIDGNLRQFGSGLSANRLISGNGYMIIGQEQDTLGGKFSQAETFVGRMTLIDIWSKVLTKEDIFRHYHDCVNPIYGDLYTWGEFQFHIQGNLRIESSHFCNECPRPKNVFNGQVEVIENSAFYKCNEGYKIGNDFKNGRKCLKSSKWEGQREPYCRRLYCGPPGFLKNGFIHGTNYYFEDQVICGCVYGYNLIGEERLTCGKYGKWEPAKPKCIGPQCKAFKIPANGKFTVFTETPHEEYKEDITMLDVGTQIEITCKEGTNLIGESVITCQDEGVWDNDPPVCESPYTTTPKPIRCSVDELPSAPEHGYLVEESLEAYQNEVTKTVEYNCNIGFLVEGLNSSFCRDDGSWSDVDVTCNRVSCGYPSMLDHGFVVQKNYLFGDEAIFDCETGYYLNGSSSISCGENGLFEESMPKCIRITCNAPDANAIKNGKVYGKNNFFGDILRFECDQGFILNGSSFITCGKEGVWSSEFPECRKISCGPPGDLDNGFSFGRSYKYGNYITFECKEGLS